MSKVTVKKNKENPFVQLYKKTLEDNRLTWKAKGVWAYLMSKPDNWIVRVEDLVNRSSNDKRDSIRTALRNLEENGYIIRTKARNEKGKYAGYDYVIFETAPETEKPSPDYPKTDYPATDNPIHNNNDCTNTDINNNNNNNNREIIMLLEKYKIEKNTIQELCSDYDATQILENIEYAEANKSGICNLSGWVVSSIRKNRQFNETEKREREKMKEKRIQVNQQLDDDTVLSDASFQNSFWQDKFKKYNNSLGRLNKMQ